MIIKRVQIKKTGQISLAVLHENSWVVIEQLLTYSKKDKSRERALLSEVSDDLILFLQHREQVESKLFSLISDARKKKKDLRCDCTDMIPFQPLMYRDFMLSEKHVINSSRGFIKRLFPAMVPIVKMYEGITKRTFPAFLPKKPWYDNPVYYKGNHMSFFTGGDEIQYPGYATLKDYELELGMIITREIFNATEAEAKEAIGAFCIFNDFSARNVQIDEMKKTGFGPSKAKDFANAISSVVVTADELWPHIDSLETRVFINDKLTAQGKTDEFYHSLEKAVAYASLGEHVYPGEFMASGTIPNCCGMENGVLLEYGDEIRLEIDMIGELTNRIGSMPD
jgi:2-keto-4-pentenoate hydratase/2-oxohepta-3-ene-1,7-dioic acid hydratase in catechol pathway